ncbi:metallophosphoesterase family protein [Actinokineospora pegani]|uniref:metallophosphoesterase family protein n=1 Tax=Actinokineospora pegani TaxID=2654637 RepID=UPI001F477A59|nr:metallophosphoesterase [Actinokineospora pegani]
MSSAPRPRDMSEEQLGFQPQEAVRWLAPKVLVTTGIQSVIASIFGSYADKRELQGSLPAEVHRFPDADDDGAFWLDYVADLGDGFDATYSVASLLAAEELDLPDAGPLPRGRLLVMGGDQVYPSASTRAYEDRTKGVYRAALPEARGESPTLFALPGNHDWYDGLTSFLRVFAQKRAFGGWETAQTRSYFAVQLPHRWWLCAIDTQFDDYIDGPQLEYFRSISQEMRPGDGVILCTPTPVWVAAGSGHEVEKYDTIDFFDREVVRPRGAEVRVMLSGDKHHYARYAETGGDRQRITAGIGGAYLSATHELPRDLVLPPPKSRMRDKSPTAEYALAARYPKRLTSEAFAAGIFRLPLRNPGFWGLTGVLQTVMTLAVLYGLVETLGEQRDKGFFGMVASWTPALIVAVVLLLGGTAFAKIERFHGGGTATWAGVLHALAHIGLSVGWSFVVIWLYTTVLPRGVVDDWATLAIVLVGTPVVIGFLDAELVALYLMVASRFGINLNEVMAGQSIEHYKGFLRLRISADGDLTVHPVGLDRVGRRWRADPGGAAHEPWLTPSRPLRPRLIEAPVTVPRVSARPAAG